MEIRRPAGLSQRDDPPIAQRKAEQLALATSAHADAARSAGWEDVHPIPCSIPELARADVDTSAELLGRRLRAPVAIAAMTGGHPGAAELNATLGAAAEALGLAVGVGSQRAALADPSLAPTFAAVRRHAPSAFVLANLGACQLIAQPGAPALSAGEVERAIEMVEADALAIHLNVLEETIQPGGDERFDGILHALAALCARVSVPVIAKETGAGLTRECAQRLVEAGVAALDVGGVGGTSFAGIERARAERAGDERRAALGRTFADWGLPTAAAVLEVRDLGVPVIATGGVRNGLDAAKALALGADAVGIARVALDAAQDGLDALLARIEMLVDELAVAMLLSGARSPEGLRRPAPVVTGFTHDWAQQRGLLERSERA